MRMHWWLLGLIGLTACEPARLSTGDPNALVDENQPMQPEPAPGAPPTSPPGEPPPMMPPTSPPTDAPPAGDARLSESVAVTGVSLLQALEAPLSPDGAMPMVPLLPERDSQVKIAVALRGAPGDVVAAVDLDDETFTVRTRIAASTDPNRPDSYVRVAVPGSAIRMGGQLRVRMLTAAGAADEIGHPATWPPNGALTLPLSPSPQLTVTVVTLRNAPSGNSPDAAAPATPERLAVIRDAIIAQYPISPSALTVRARPQEHVTQVVPPTDDYDGAMLDELLTVHQNDNAPDNEVYYGLVTYDTGRFPCPNPEFACYGGGVAFGRTADDIRLGGFPAVAVGGFAGSMPSDVLFWSDENGFPPDQLPGYAELEQAPVALLQEQASTETVWDTYAGVALHEIGHTFSLDHVDTPFQPQDGNFRDNTFPRADGSIGVEGYDPTYNRHLDGRYYRDFMSYSTITWVSDHNYRKLYELLASAARGKQKCRRVPHTGGRLVLDADEQTVGLIATSLKQFCATEARDAVTVSALDPEGLVIDVVLGRRIETSNHRTRFLYFPVVDDAVAYRIEARPHDIVMPAR